MIQFKKQQFDMLYALLFNYLFQAFVQLSTPRQALWQYQQSTDLAHNRAQQAMEDKSVDMSSEIPGGSLCRRSASARPGQQWFYRVARSLCTPRLDLVDL